MQKTIQPIMMHLVFATQNPHKVDEIRQLLPPDIRLSTLRDIHGSGEIPETGDTLEANASLKSKFVEEHYRVNCFADDTGLEIDALDGAPGVYTARYAGPDKQAGDNTRLVLEKMCGNPRREARFRTVISLRIDGEETLFEGVVNGLIRTAPSGTEGFGYDPIFQPEGYAIPFSEMTTEEKNAISHRGKAIRQLVTFLNNR